MKFIETKTATKDKKWILKSYSKSVQAKLKYLVDEIIENPREGLGKPEQLKYSLKKELWSRELTQKDRIVYGIEAGLDYGLDDKEIIVFYQYLDHYLDK